MSRWELVHTAEDRSRRRNVAVGQIVIQRRQIHLAPEARILKQPLQLRGEHPLPVHFSVEQRLFAYPIPREEQRLGALIPQRKCEHPPKPLHAVRAVRLVGVDDDLGVAPSSEPKPELLQALSQLLEVVDLAVEGHPDRPVFVAHRLSATGHVQDGEPSLTQRYRPVDVVPFVVRTTVSQLSTKFAHERWIERTT